MKVQAHAKINWTLNITGKRSDGYHLMDMMMQSLSLCDELELNLRTDGKISLSVKDSTLLPDEHNLVFRAAKTLKDFSGTALGADILLTKRIPMGAGLGGGSADAAAALRGLIELWQLSVKEEDLYRIGLSLGADVPFCLFHRPARVRGIGEIIKPICIRTCYELLLIQPCDALSTKEAFSFFDSQLHPLSPDHQAALSAFETGNTEMIGKSCLNVMQHASEKLRPQMTEALQDLKSSGAFLSQMTGSGSVVFGAYENKEKADRAFENLHLKYPVCIRTHTV